jgi:hypothetical protein
MNPRIVVNSIIQWVPDTPDGESRLERILWIDSIGTQVVVISLSDSKPLPLVKSLDDLTAAISAGSALLRTIDPILHAANHDPEYIRKHRQRMERAWELIADIAGIEPDIYLVEHRGKLIAQAAKQFRVSRKEIYKYLRRYWISGKMRYALVPNYYKSGAAGKEREVLANEPAIPKRGRPSKILRFEPEHTGVNVTKEMKMIFDAARKLFGEKDLKKTYEQMIDRFFNDGHRKSSGVKVPVILPAFELPTFNQFSYWIRKRRCLAESIIARRGQRKYDLTSRPILGNSTQMAYGPGAIFQVDATIADVYLVSRLNRNWIIGRPVVYFVVDVFSRMVVGLYVGLEGPSWITGMMSIVNTTTDKVAFCAELGIEITFEVWPCTYLCESLLADRGEFLGLESDRLPGSLEIPVANCPPYRADWKGIVEQMFRRVNLKAVSWIPGQVRRREPGEPDHRLDAILDLRQFTKIITLNAIEYNHSHWIKDYPMDTDLIRDQVQPVPIDLWNWGIKNRTGHLRTRPPEIIKLSLMPTKMATVTESGIVFEKMHYSTPRALQEDWFVKARTQGTWRVPVAYDPRRLNEIYLPNKEKTSFDICTLLPVDRSFKDCVLEEVQDHFELYDTLSKQHNNNRMQSGAEYRAKVADVVTEATEMKQASASNESDARRVNGIRDNRQAEKEMLREAEAFNLGKKTSPAEPGIVLPLRPKDVEEAPDEPVTTPASRKRDLLSALKKNVQGDEPEEGGA